MKRQISALLLVLFTLALQAQTSLSGRTYHHPDIMAEGMKAYEKDLEEKMAEVISQEVSKAENKKGAPLSADEKAQIRAKQDEAIKFSMAVMKATRTAMTPTFKSDTELVMQADITLDEDALKAAGLGWAQRKALKAAISLTPSTQKMAYTTKDNLIFCNDGAERDTLVLSDDGKYLYGEFEEGKTFKLTRTK
jgi:hypothetical protein